MRIGIISGLASGLAGIAFYLVSVASAADFGSWEQLSEGGHFLARLRPPETGIRLGEFQQWELSLQDSQARAIDDASIAVGGGMPNHAHGLPSQPLVTGYLGNGRYLIEGMKLHMDGSWIIAFGVETARAKDRLMFEIEITTASSTDNYDSFYLPVSARPPPSPGNHYADNPQAADLGERIFFDPRFSGNGKLSCASCHQPERFFTDGLPRGIGMQSTLRNTPTLQGAAFQSWFYWDGRRDSLWSQALVPFEAAEEMGSDRLAVIRKLGKNPEYRRLYESVFNPFPQQLLGERLPTHAGPLGGKSTRDAWFEIDEATREQINRVFANLGKAIAAYERQISMPVTRLDRYLEMRKVDPSQARQLMSADELAGLALFADTERTHCTRCHNGSWFRNGDFHNIGTGSFSGERLDFGRVFGVRAAIIDEFNCLGNYSDASPSECDHFKFMNRSSHVPLEGAFRVPGLRLVGDTAPYMHDGRFANLELVIDYYRNPPSEGVNGLHELPSMEISDLEARQLVAFLQTLSRFEPE